MDAGFSRIARTVTISVARFCLQTTPGGNLFPAPRPANTAYGSRSQRFDTPGLVARLAC